MYKEMTLTTGHEAISTVDRLHKLGHDPHLPEGIHVHRDTR